MSRFEQIFFQGKHTDGQQLLEKILYSINHQRNANQNHHEISPFRIAFMKKARDNKCL